MVFAAVPAGMRAQHVQQGPQTLAAAGNDVIGHLVDQHHLGIQRLADAGVDPRHVGGAQFQDPVEACARMLRGGNAGGGNDVFLVHVLLRRSVTN